MPTQTLPKFRENRSISATQRVLHRAKSMNAVSPIQVLSSSTLPSTHINVSQTQIGNAHHHITKNGHHHHNVPIDYLEGDDPLAMPLPGPRVFIGSLNKKQQQRDKYLTSLEMPDFHGLLGNQVMSVKEYLNRIGIDDLDKNMSINDIRREFFVKMGFSKRDPLINNIPRHIQQQILTYLDIKLF